MSDQDFYPSWINYALYLCYMRGEYPFCKHGKNKKCAKGEKVRKNTGKYF